MNGTLTLTEKGQTCLPMAWRKRQGLEHGGPVRYTAAGNALVLTPVPPLSEEEIANLLKTTGGPVPPPKNWRTLVRSAVKESRHARRH